MTRGHSLGQDLKFLVNNPKYSDIEILCGDEKKLYGVRAILAARSEVFDRLFYNGMKESYESKISFPSINSSGMEIILEYTYTGSVSEGSLNKDNVVEAFYTADYFQLPDLQDLIIKTVIEMNYAKNYSPELLSKVVNTMPLTEDDILLNLFVETIAITSLNTIEFGRLSIEALQYLLICTHEKEKPFATPEYEVFRYSTILVAKQVSNFAYQSLLERLPTLERLNLVQVEDEFITDHQKVAKELEPLVKFIDFRRIDAQIIADVIEPLNIIRDETILNVYRHKPKLGLDDIRGRSYLWDKEACGSKLIIEDNGKVVQAAIDCDFHQYVSAKTILFDKGIFEWDVIIEKTCADVWVGICASENFDYGFSLDLQSTEWTLSSAGACSNSYGEYGILDKYCPPFGDGAKITIHLDMNKRTCSFTVNGVKYPEVPDWDSTIPSKLHPVVSLRYPGRIQIQPHQKFDC